MGIYETEEDRKAAEEAAAKTGQARALELTPAEQHAQEVLRG
jgi:hypothetical protein